MNRRIVIAIIFAVMFCISHIWAEVPQLINYQGELTDGSGNPLNTTVSIVFTIYDNSTGGTEKWSEVHPSVTVNSGLFSVILGETLPIDDSVFVETTRWLGIQVGADPEITPRTQLITIPYAYRVSTVDGATGGIISGDVAIQSILTVDTAGIGTDTPRDLLEIAGANGAGITIRGDQSDYSPFLTLNNPDNDTVSVLTARDGNAFNFEYPAENRLVNFDTSGNVGIASGVTPLTDRLEVYGTVRVMGFRMPTGAVDGWVLTSNDTGWSTWQPAVGAPDNDWTDAGTGSMYTTFLTDSVGIGIETPTEKFDVDGNIHASGTITSGNSIAIDGVTGTITVTGPGNDMDLITDEIRISGKATIGPDNVNTGVNAFVAGRHNKARGDYAVVCGGGGPGTNDSNSALGDGSIVGAGRYNTASGVYSLVGAGSQNRVSGGYGGIMAGLSNTSTGGYSIIGAGNENVIGGTLSGILGGSDNYIDGDFSAILGGFGDTITSTADYSYLFGIQSTLTQDSTFMVDMPHIRFGDEATGYEFPTADGSSGQVMQTDGSGQVTWATVSGSGDITAVNADNGLTGGGATGDVTMYIDSGWVDGFVDTADVRFADSAGLAATTRFADSTEAITDGAIDFVDIGQNGATNNQVMKWNGSVWVADDDIAGGAAGWAYNGNIVSLETSTDSVGLGTATPTEKLDVNGNIISSGTITSGNSITIDGVNDKIMASGGTIDFDDENIITTGKAAFGPETYVWWPNCYVFGEVDSVKGYHSVISGGFHNIAGGQPWDSATVVSGGSYNIAQGSYSTVGGGHRNSASNNYHNDGATCAGGVYNSAAGAYSFVGGGLMDSTGNYSVTVGGEHNVVNGSHSAIVGGLDNRIEGANTSHIGGGLFNYVADYHSTIGGGEADSIYAGVGRSTIGGGYHNVIDDANWCSISGGRDNYARARASTVGGGEHNRAQNNYSTVAGGQSDTAKGVNSFVGGGRWNIASGAFSTLCGGDSSEASGDRSTVGGGWKNAASGTRSYVGGGLNNEASGQLSTASGGANNIADGRSATVPGGELNAARGEYSFAAGNRAKANHDGSFVIAANYPAGASDSVESGGNEQMVLRADGGIYLTNTAELAPYDNTNIITTRGGAYLSGNGTNWTNASDRNKKENFKPVDGQEILGLLERLKITQWNYKEDDNNVTHIGPVAQDFYALFELGGDDKSISTVDPAGVSLAAIKALYVKNQELDAEVAELKALVRQLLDQNK